MPPPPPPPPPPICFPFTNNNKKPRRRLSWSSSDRSVPYRTHEMARRPSFSPDGSFAGGGAESITFHSDSEKYDDVPEMYPPPSAKDKKPKLGRGNSLSLPGLKRGNTVTGTKKSTMSNKWGGWGNGKNKEKDLPPTDDGMDEEEEAPIPIYKGPVRQNSRSTQASRSTQRTQDSQRTMTSQRSKESHRDNDLRRNNSSRSTVPKPRPPLMPQDSTSTLVGSAFERKINDRGSIRERPDTTERLDELRKLMLKDTLDYYVVPSEDAHQSEYVAPSDKRREYISGFSGSAGQAIITRSHAYLIVDSRYWLQAREQVDDNWDIVRVGSMPGEPKDWIDWITGRLNKGSRIGIDARMISHEKAQIMNSKIGHMDSKLVYPPQNLVDLVWKDKPPKPREPLYTQPIEYTGRDAISKINRIREWIKDQPAAMPAYTKGDPSPQHMHVGTLIVSLSQIAYTLNLRGTDIPYNPLFHAYLFIGLDSATVFVDSSKVDDLVSEYLATIHVERKDYTELWPFLRRRPWGEGKLLISPQTSYAISLMLTNFRYTVMPSHVEHMMAIKNEVEIDGMRRAYLRDGVSFVRFFAWLESKLAEGYDITEYEAASRLTEFRKKNKNFMGLAYENISASGPNAALPHYSPRKLTAKMIDRETPYVNDSGGQYRDGTCDTTRTVHFGRPSSDQCEAYTRVLQGHIAIDAAIFPEGTSGHQLDVLARKALWKDGMNYNHGTGHGVGSFLTVHEGPHSFSNSTALQPGHVITNEPGFYLEGRWGIRIESALVVKRVKTRGNFNGDIWLGFERLTCVPIQTRMVKENMLTKEEKTWLKEHNQRCWDLLAPYLKEDKRALKWLEREVKRGFGLASAPGGVAIEWD
ncbi:aminopeptidase-P [Ephemerocybe angulata]|uniref:Aminopeptidase-P n=1 Tax=Ephemerocybe angulata TaxID=980116 RepID=A0A8H6HD78_9AGAR|nr:aminopeptidase-P [Tulosesus angulatus]